MYTKGLFAFIVTATGIIGAGKVATEVADGIITEPATVLVADRVTQPVPVVRREENPPPTTTPPTTTTVPDVSDVDWAGLTAMSVVEQKAQEPLAVDEARRQFGKCGEWRDLALMVGWPAEEWYTLSHVLYRESRCSIGSHNKADPVSGSRGLMQINGFWCRPSKYFPQGWLQTQGLLETCEDLFDPVVNLRSGLAIWLYGEDRHGCGWRGPWATSCNRYTKIQPHPGL
jgi:hypothetical protein